MVGNGFIVKTDLHLTLILAFYSLALQAPLNLYPQIKLPV